MLNYFRERAQSFLIKAVLWVVVLSFVGTIFLVWGRGRQKTETNVVATIAGEKVYEAEFLRAYKNLMETYRRMYGDEVMKNAESLFNVKSTALDQLLKEKLLIHLAKGIGLMVTDLELSASIAGMEAFQRNGVFDRELYNAILRANRMTPQGFEASYRLTLLAEKVEKIVRESVRLTREEVRTLYIRENEEAKVSYVTIKPEEFRDQVAYTDEDIEKYYSENKKKFKEPEKVKVRYVSFSSEDYADAVEVSPEEIENYYNDNSTRYTQGERVRVRHILLKLDPKASAEEEEKVRSLGKELLKKLDQGADFEELAKEYSDDVNTKDIGGDLGYFGRGDMVKPFEEAAFSLEAGQRSGLVRTQFGYHIIEVLDHPKKGIKPLEEVREEVAGEVKRMKGALEAEKSAEEFLDRVYLVPEKFAEIADESSLSLVETDYMDRGAADGKLALWPQFSGEVFKLKKGDVSDVITADGQYYVFQLLEKRESQVPDLSSIREKVIADYVDKASRDVASEKAREVFEEIKSAKSLEDISAFLDEEIVTTDYFKRAGPVEGVGADANFIDAAFSHKKGEYALVTSYSVNYIMKILDRRGIDEGKFEEEFDQYQERFLKAKQKMIYDLWIGRVMDQAEISLRKDFLL